MPCRLLGFLTFSQDWRCRTDITGLISLTRNLGLKDRPSSHYLY